MVRARPKFDDPPVVETAIGVQFNSLAGYSTGHAGWFWKEYLGKLGDWSRAVDAPRLEDQFERFGAEDVWKPPISMKFLQNAQSQRTQIIRADEERMVQLQDSRLVLNWKKHSAEYPSFDGLLPEFRDVLHAFEAFAHEANFGTPGYNQWEVAYIDQFKRGDMWDSPREWSKIFPGLTVVPPLSHESLAAGDETMSADWRFSLRDRRGRVYISLRQLRLAPTSDEVLNVTFVARGPVNEVQTWEQGLMLGHDVVNDTFINVTSNEAHSRWKKRA
ncbi:MAG: TIGR04255 family protein [Candidatus Acidiferrales bacterium]